VLLDPANVRELDRAKLEEIVAATRRLDEVVDVTVSANRAETKVLASDRGGDSLAADGKAAFDHLGVERFVGHSVTESVVVTAEGSTTVAVEPVESPELTTSAGDHFNAGFALGLIEDLPDEASVALGNALAREFVRTGETPSYADVVSAVASYDAQFD
jgi:sugar/nucleoside kinase (ribokinase family)